MLRMKDTNKLIKNILRALPFIPLLAPKKTSIAPYVLGGIAVALVGGVAAVMIFSPRTRYRALDAAKEGYGKVKSQIGQLPFAAQLGIESDDGRTPSPQQHYAGETGSPSYSNNTGA